ncbi:MAG TPA: hypothetical protein VK028_10300 [Micromonosporaceae bacterium]|nr:hypothetical protein [Micromonosporaceae bacterium]
MTARRVRAPRIDFSNLRRELELPTQFPLAAQRGRTAETRPGALLGPAAAR